MGLSVAQRDAALTVFANGTTYLAAFVSGVEVTGNNYSRVLVNNIAGGSPAWTTPAVDAGDAQSRYTQVDAQVSFPTPTGSWGTPDEIRVMDAVSSGTAVADIPIPTIQRYVVDVSRPLIIAANGCKIPIRNTDSTL